ncbi:MAG: histidinol phosphate phosphatase domain-containing protein, partial [Syntrophobacterales bacterium]|nr:histidinol phosphate phosphatase domain-containing protein [Syntrophobacterales bacterium]
MIDLHTHSFFSDGELLPSELVQRAAEKGYQAIAITDHADLSNIDFVIPRITKVCQQMQKLETIRVIPGIELTHVPPAHIADLVREGRLLGAKIIVVHGETIVEPVAEGTNRAAVMAGIDILAHP